MHKLFAWIRTKKMKLCDALKLLEEGKKIRCISWDKKYYWTKDSLDKGEQYWDDCAYRIFRMTKEEWELYEEPEQMLSFSEVVKGLRDGKRFKRKGWPNKEDFIFSKDKIIREQGGFSAFLYIEDFEAADWVEVKE